ncbi:MAG: phosphoribosylformylglycinamidine synthase I, partial [Promethearchaeota archaeon]
RVKRIHVNDFINRRESLENYQILMFPGGFSFGDYLGAGTVLANKFRYTLRQDLSRFIDEGKLIFGVCNGFQVLVKMGILPGFHGDNFKQSVSLIENQSGMFEDRWVKLKTIKSRCIWTEGYDLILEVPVRHGEGKFVTKDPKIISRLWEEEMIPFVYEPNEYPNNPNGSIDGIAGICNEAGNVFGMMPHPECHLIPYNHPNWTRGEAPKENGLKIFQNAVNYAKGHF